MGLGSPTNWLTPEHTPSRQTAAYRVTSWDKFRQLLSEAPSHDKMFKLTALTRDDGKPAASKRLN
ncbi:hypothetical protein HPB52_003100 [Rhipicephalus sanguineus]|uniref:Uncharacterized protein n=1 Tax=Rhipicephalus sanguineus TaxID=34632 RepID=A0A9D4QF22_RHISA|nr:hypothetical protein HPB52_003100 [Rhipicephalus sanguineus]